MKWMKKAAIVEEGVWNVFAGLVKMLNDGNIGEILTRILSKWNHETKSKLEKGEKPN